MGEFRMPSLGADMTHGTLVQWNVKPRDPVKRGDIVAIVGTDKADIEVEVYQTGVIDKLTAEPGDRLAVGAPMAWIRVEGEAPEEVALPLPAATPAPARVEAAPTPPSAPPPTHVRASPMARKVAEELGVDLAQVKGTGPHGAIERGDVELAAKLKAQPAAPAAERAAGMRHAIAMAMERSNREIPHYYLSTQIDMSKALHWLEEFNRQRSVENRVLPAALLLKAVAQALRKVPELNGFWIDGKLQSSADIHVGIVVSLRTGGLIVPAIHSADRKPVEEIMAAMREAIGRARTGRLRSSDITDSTITVTNLGDLGVEGVLGVIYPPQVALVGFGKIMDRPWAEAGMLGIRPILTATLAADHRATDGRQGAQFLEAMNAILQQPESL